MAESQTTPASISLDNEGRIVITAPQLAEALKGAEASLRPQRLSEFIASRLPEK